MSCRIITFYADNNMNGSIALCQMWFGQAALPQQNFDGRFYPNPFSCAHCTIAGDLVFQHLKELNAFTSDITGKHFRGPATRLMFEPELWTQLEDNVMRAWKRR